VQACCCGKVSAPPTHQRLNALREPGDLEEFANLYARALRRQFQLSGFRGSLNRYRTSVLDFQQQAEVAERRVEQPAAFIAGSLEPVLRTASVDLIEIMRNQVSDLRFVRLIENAGHRVQQERPAEVNATLLEFLRGL
jgi:pimeloyl-ACP methyl ester carboxylesterase